MSVRGRDLLDTGEGQRRPPWLLLWLLRPLARFLARRWWRVRTHGEELVPRQGPVILASNHTGLVDGPLLAAFAPRPVHVVTKSDMFTGALGVLLAGTGQISLERWVVDPSALRTSVAVLRHGGTVGLFPEGTRGPGDLRRCRGGAAYLALVTGAPVVPVTILGTREPGTGSNSVPGRGAVVDIVYGEPFRLDQVAWPRTRAHTEQARGMLHAHLRGTLQQALTRTGRTLPGPLVQPGDQPPGVHPDEGARG